MIMSEFFKTQLEINKMGVGLVSSFRGFSLTSTPTAEPAANLKAKESQLEHKIQVSVIDYASLTSHKARNGHTNQKKAVAEVKVPLMS